MQWFDPGPREGRNALSRLPRPLPGPEGRALRVGLLQPALPKYRVPVFLEFASRSRIELQLCYGVEANIRNAEAEGFAGTEVPCRVLFRRFWWYPDHLSMADPKRYDVVMFPWNSRHLSAFAGLLLCRLRGVATVLWGHGYSKNESRLKRLLRWWLGSLADTCVLYNYGTAIEFAKASQKERVFVALNCLDQAPIRAQREAWLGDPGRLEGWQKHNGIDPKRTILFVSRLLPENGIDLLLRAAAALRERHPGVTVAIVGTGPDEERLKRLAGELGIQSAVRFVGAVYEESRIAPWFLSSRVFCYPQNIGLSILHAFGYGVPVITSDNFEGQNPEIEAMRPDENGLTYPDGSMDGLIRALDRILSDDALASRLSNGARRTVEERFNLPWMVDGLEAAARAAYARRKGILTPVPAPPKARTVKEP